MNKYLAKGVASALLITTVAGGMMLAPINQDVEAASKTYKLCKHTQISSTAHSKSIKHGTTSKGKITIKSINNKNSHTHVLEYNDTYYPTFNTNKSTVNDTSTYTTKVYNTKTKKYSTYTGGISLNLRGTKYTGKHTRRLNGKIVTNQLTNRSIACPECKLDKNKVTRNFTVKCPYCSQKATINCKTGKIS